MKLLWLSVLILIADQLTKQIVRIQMELGQSIPVLGDLLRWTYIENPGMAFGIDPGNKLFFSIFTIVIVVGLSWYYFHIRHEDMSQRLPLAIILGGAYGNLIDRVFYGLWFQDVGFLYGRVVDFVDVNIPDINLLGFQMDRWPVFNIADSAVSIGVILMIILYKPTPSDIKNPETDLQQSDDTRPDTDSEKNSANPRVSS